MLAKLVTATISPLGTALLLGLCGVAVLVLGSTRRSRRRGLLCAAAALTWLWLWSTPLASDALRGWLERRAGPRTVDAVPTARVMVVLGGSIAGPRPPLRPYPDLGAAADRLWHAARLYRAGKAEMVLLSGGARRPEEPPEAESMRQFLLELGVPASAMLLETASDTTASNAAFTARMLSERRLTRVILVTSALHMRRARRAFERAGIHVSPAPTDFEVVDMPMDLLRVVPQADALAGSASAMKEIVGALVGR